jgi:antitoxin component of MazEF toxin-antitoxin module
MTKEDSDKLSVDHQSAIPCQSRPKYRLADLLKQLKPSQQQKETDWGKPRGNEI